FDATAAPRAVRAGDAVGAAPAGAARRLCTTMQLSFVRRRRGGIGLVPPPVDDIDAVCTPAEKAMVDGALACSVVGDEAGLRAGIAEFGARHRPDELLLTANIFDHEARPASFAMAARACTARAGVAQVRICSRSHAAGPRDHAAQ